MTSGAIYGMISHFRRLCSFSKFALHTIFSVVHVLPINIGVDHDKNTRGWFPDSLTPVVKVYICINGPREPRQTIQTSMPCAPLVPVWTVDHIKFSVAPCSTVHSQFTLKAQVLIAQHGRFVSYNLFVPSEGTKK